MASSLSSVCSTTTTKPLQFCPYPVYRINANTTTIYLQPNHPAMSLISSAIRNHRSNSNHQPDLSEKLDRYHRHHQPCGDLFTSTQLAITSHHHHTHNNRRPNNNLRPTINHVTHNWGINNYMAHHTSMSLTTRAISDHRPNSNLRPDHHQMNSKTLANAPPPPPSPPQK